MIDHDSDPGAWENALRYPSAIRVLDDPAAYISAIESELNERLALRKAVRTAYSIAQRGRA